jgi:protein tyrosine phosphatase (PTP) superfamily phosphohydrolase (DUF442 family)
MDFRGLYGITNYLPVSATIGSAGQPEPSDWQAIRHAGYRVVINLAVGESAPALAEEQNLVAEHGMAYVHIPVVWTAPTTQDLEDFFAAMDAAGDQKVFVHCVVNKRVSCFLFLYRVVRLGVPPEQAAKTMRVIWEPNEVWACFLQGSLVHFGLAMSSDSVDDADSVGAKTGTER